MTRAKPATKCALRPHCDESGATSVLMLGFFVVVLMLCAVVIDASAAYLARQRLDTLAEGASVAAASAIATDRLYLAGAEEVQLDASRASQAAADHLRRVGAMEDHPSLKMQVSAQGDTVVVNVSSQLSLPFRLGSWGAAAPVRASAAAQVSLLP